ncbi:MAG: glycosyltransferase family 4 protein [Blastocatellia bacterium]|nr:glycosyltransferase family 4 protein [Blastocatellia bacterium]
MRKLDWIAAHGGMALINTHPDYMSFSGSAADSFEYPVRFYKEFLSYIRDNHAGSYWQALPREVAAHCSPLRRRTDERAEDTLIPASREEYSTSATDLDCHGRSENFPLAKVDLAESESSQSAIEKRRRLRGKHAAVILFSYFPADPRPRRAAEALIAEGVTVDMICLQNEGVPSREVINGVNVFRLPIKRCRGSKIKYVSQYSAFIIRAFWMLASRSFSRRYDFVHIHNMPDVLVFSALVPKVLGAKIILDLHDPMPELMQTIFGMSESSFGVRFLKVLEKMSVGFADLVITVNLACKRIYSARSCRPEKITVVMNAPEDTIFRLKPPSRDLVGGNGSAQPFSLLYHGSLVPRNGLDLAVDALEIASHRIPNLQLRVCGERNSYFEKVMESAHRRGLGAKVVYLGMKNRWEIVEAINCCDLGVVPNQRNTFTEINTPTRIFEYLSLGKPVIAPRTLGIEDYFGNDDLIFFEAGDKQDLARQIEFAYTNREELLRVVERGQRVYLAHTWSQQKSNFLESIGELV